MSKDINNHKKINTYERSNTFMLPYLCFSLISLISFISLFSLSLFPFSAIAQEYVDENTVVEERVVNAHHNAPDGPPTTSFTPPPPVGTPVACDDSIPMCRPPMTFIFDSTFSPIVGAEAFISGLRVYQLLDDNFVPSTQGSTDGTMVFARLGKLALEYLLFETVSTAQHEIFGHGARGREFHFEPMRYRIRIGGGGSTHFQRRDYLRLSPNEKMAFTTGGVESTYILAKQLRNRWLDAKYLDEREGQLYLLTALDQTHYILKTHNKPGRRFFNAPFLDDRHDIMSYIRQINAWHRRHVLTASDLRRYALFDLLDPYLYLSLFSIGQYLYDGTQGFEYPMLDFGNIQYLPGFRLALAPYAPEYQFINYFRGLDQTVQFTLRYSNLASRQSYGLILEVLRLWSSDLLNFDGRLDLWNQPKLHTHFFRRSEDNKWGIGASIMARYRVNNSVELKAQLGYKTTGYIPGEALKHTPIIRAGINLQL